MFPVFLQVSRGDLWRELEGECIILSSGGWSTILNWSISPHMSLFIFLNFSFFPPVILYGGHQFFPLHCRKSKVPLFHPSSKELTSASLELRLVSCSVIPALWDAPGVMILQINYLLISSLGFSVIIFITLYILSGSCRIVFFSFK